MRNDEESGEEELFGKLHFPDFMPLSDRNNASTRFKGIVRDAS